MTQLFDFSPLLLPWYDLCRRDLPWRTDPPEFYPVWVSEIMLQQTKVEAVKPYYLRFLRLFPTLSHLAHASEEQVDKAWEGLGYYSRGRNLRKGAIAALSMPRIPCSYDALLTLPGVGPYTAAAIASIVFGEAVPAVDGNVLRVTARLLCLEEDMRLEKSKALVRTLLEKIIPQDRPGDFNQAMMELGATVCTPRSPSCALCPISSCCHAYSRDTVSSYPLLSPKAARKSETYTVFLITDPRGWAQVEKRPEKGLLPGLYGFPMYKGLLPPDQVAAHLQDVGEIDSVTEIGCHKHIFTHKEWLLTAYHVCVSHDCNHFLSPARTARECSIPGAFQFIYQYWRNYYE